MDLPIPHTNKVAVFSKIAGVENLDSLKKSGKYIPGCYRIWGLNRPDDLCYIGQAKHLGTRIKQHAKGNNLNTSAFCFELGDSAKVDLFLLSGINDIPFELSISNLLCLLEQYLIFKYKPKINKLLVARPGIIWTKDVIAKHREKVGKKVYIYLKSENKKKITLELIYICDSASYASQLFGYERSWIKNILIRNKGWYKAKIYFSSIPLKELCIDGKMYNVIESLKEYSEIKKYVSKIINEISYRYGKKIRIINTKTGEINTYRSKKEAADALNADPASIYNRDKLFRGIYKIIEI